MKTINEFIFQHTKFVLKKELKQSAIDDVKKFKNEIEKNMIYDNYLERKIIARDDIDSQDKLAKIEYIKKKFNLTKEEIK